MFNDLSPLPGRGPPFLSLYYCRIGPDRSRRLGFGKGVVNDC